VTDSGTQQAAVWSRVEDICVRRRACRVSGRARREKREERHCCQTLHRHHRVKNSRDFPGNPRGGNSLTTQEFRIRKKPPGKFNPGSHHAKQPALGVQDPWTLEHPNSGIARKTLHATPTSAFQNGTKVWGWKLPLDYSWVSGSFVVLVMPFCR